MCDIVVISKRECPRAWRVYVVQFRTEDLQREFLEGRTLNDLPKRSFAKFAIHPPDGQVRESNLIAAETEEEAIKVAKDALRNPHSSIRANHQVDPSTPIYVTNNSDGTRRLITSGAPRRT